MNGMCVPAASQRLLSRSSTATPGNVTTFWHGCSGIFSEHVVRTWCDCPQAPFSDIGRPTLRKPGEAHGYTLDFTLEDRQSGQCYAAEMKCWITWENYRYLRLTEASQLEGITRPAFVEFLAFARDPAAYQVFVKGTPAAVTGAILVWGAAAPQGRAAATALGIANVLTVEEMVRDLHAWHPVASTVPPRAAQGLPVCAVCRCSLVTVVCRRDRGSGCRCSR